MDKPPFAVDDQTKCLNCYESHGRNFIRIECVLAKCKKFEEMKREQNRFQPTFNSVAK